MPSRAKKESILKDNYDQAIARSKRDYIKDNGKSMPKKRQEHEKKIFQDALKGADKRLGEVWNDIPSKAKDIPNRPTFGQYFGGVDFNKDGTMK